jgi:transcriptional regulator GlxA family with amidase domain
MKSELALTNTQTQHVVILLQPRFIMKELLEAIEWFKCANEVVNHTLFEWHLCSEEGSVLLADNGMVLSALRHPNNIAKSESVLVFSGSLSDQSTQILNRQWLGEQVLKRTKIYQFQPATNDSADEFKHDHLAELMAEIVMPLLNVNQNKALLANLKQSNGLSLRVTDSRVHKALSLMRDNIEEPLDSKTIANQSFLSLRQLERLFKQYFDESPNRHYTKLRLKKAKHLLLRTDLKVGDVSQACGFSTVPYFCKAYRDCFGLTPLQSKEQLQKSIQAF